MVIISAGKLIIQNVLKGETNNLIYVRHLFTSIAVVKIVFHSSFHLILDGSSEIGTHVRSNP